MFDSDFIANPYKFYSRLRATPLYWADKFRAGAWLVPRYADVNTALHDSRLSSQRSHTLTAPFPPEVQSELRPFNTIFSKLMLFLDPPQHTRIRKLLSKEFTPQMVQRLRPRIQQIVNTLIDQMIGKKEIEFMNDFANPIPVRVIAEMLGVPVEDQRKFQIWSDDIANFFGNATATADIARRAQKSLVELTEYFRALLPERRQNKGDDLVSLLLRVEEEGDALTEQDFMAQCALLLIAGHETTRNLIGNGLMALLQNPDQYEKLKQNPSLAVSAVKEFARYDSPVQFAGRSALEDFSWHDQQIKKGQTVIMLLGSANHDPDKFSNPDSLDITRNEGMSMSFGQGIHFCIGQALGYTETEIAFTTLNEQIPNLRMVDDKPDWRPNPAFRGLNSLRLTF